MIDIGLYNKDVTAKSVHTIFLFVMFHARKQSWESQPHQEKAQFSAHKLKT